MTISTRTRAAFRRLWAAIKAQEPEGALSHPDGGPGPYWPPQAPPAPRIAPLGHPARKRKARAPQVRVGRSMAPKVLPSYAKPGDCKAQS